MWLLPNFDLGFPAHPFERQESDKSLLPQRAVKHLPRPLSLPGWRLGPEAPLWSGSRAETAIPAPLYPTHISTLRHLKLLQF